jgi:hypothetical protein
VRVLTAEWAMTSAGAHGPFTPVPEDLYRHVEAAAGTVLPLTRWRHREEFRPDWAYICTSQASVEAVVASLTCAAYVPDECAEKALAVHAPAVAELMAANQVTYRQYLEGRCPAEIVDQLGHALNTSLGGYDVALLSRRHPSAHMGPTAQHLETSQLF